MFAQDRSVTTYYIGKVAEAVKMPGWDGAGTPDSLGTTGVDDLQLLRLREAVPGSVTIAGSPVELQPVSISGTTLPAPCADCVRHVGFGSVVYGEDNYRKKSIVSDLDTLTPFKFEYGTGPDGVHRGTCHGDSGGAGFMTFQGAEVLVGVINNGDEKCERESWDIRMDRTDVQDFVRSHLSAWGDCAGNTNCTSGRTNE